MSPEPTGHLVREWWMPSQEVALNNAPLVLDEHGLGQFQPRTLHLGWHLSADETRWELVSVSAEGPLLEPLRIKLGLVTKGDRCYGYAIPDWIEKIAEIHRPVPKGPGKS